LYFEEQAIEIKESQIELVFHLDAFFKCYRALNANFLAEKIGMHATLLSQYIQGTKIPSAKQLAKIQEGIHSLGKELQEVNLI
jgi:transcriptional regulator with XRE-family HTH domain